MFTTGVEEIDTKYNQLSTNVNQTAVAELDLIANLFNDADAFQTAGTAIVDFSNDSPLADGAI